jgi:hypothetical protein
MAITLVVGQIVVENAACQFIARPFWWQTVASKQAHGPSILRAARHNERICNVEDFMHISCGEGHITGQYPQEYSGPKLTKKR